MKEALPNTAPRITNSVKPLELGRIMGMQDNNEILITPMSPSEFIYTTCHEVGHILGASMSFRNNEILTPDEVLTTKVGISRDESNQFLDPQLRKAIPDEQITRALLLPLAKRLLGVITKGKYNLDRLKFNIHIDENELKQRIYQQGGSSSGVVVDGDNHLTIVNTKKSRDIELPAETVAVGCIIILENSLKKYTNNPCVPIPFTNGGQKRARKIVERAYQSTYWRLPSLVDMNE